MAVLLNADIGTERIIFMACIISDNEHLSSVPKFLMYFYPKPGSSEAWSTYMSFCVV